MNWFLYLSIYRDLCHPHPSLWNNILHAFLQVLFATPLLGIALNATGETRAPRSRAAPPHTGRWALFRPRRGRRGPARPGPSGRPRAAMAGGARRLYRRILQLHRALPPALRDLGDRYVKEEFRRHRAAGPAEAQRFLREWEASARRPAGQGRGGARLGAGQAPARSGAPGGRSCSGVGLGGLRGLFQPSLFSLLGHAPVKGELLAELQNALWLHVSRQAIFYGSQCLASNVCEHTQVYVTEWPQLYN